MAAISSKVVTYIQKIFVGRGVLCETPSLDMSNCSVCLRWLFENLSKTANTDYAWSERTAYAWIEPVINLNQSTVPNLSSDVFNELCLFTGNVFSTIIGLVFKPPSKCNFNRSFFVRLCKSLIENMILMRNLSGDLAAEVIPSITKGLLSLPVEAVPYIQRIFREILRKYCNSSDELRNLVRIQLSPRKQLIRVLLSSSQSGEADSFLLSLLS
ncbi:hypothetical protein AB6A40_003760 [Gnathostoma spinigerum]|uniref:Uncharacterized protein n=1 Tax=Gnathostoma spinigerum TaxID=75299 RepID=A0ABD6EI37_9BILA